MAPEAVLRASRACFWAGLRVMRGILGGGAVGPRFAARVALEAILEALAGFWGFFGGRLMRFWRELRFLTGWSLAAELGVRAAGSRSLATVGRGER